MKDLQGLSVEELESRREMASTVTIGREKCAGYKCAVGALDVETKTITVS